MKIKNKKYLLGYRKKKLFSNKNKSRPYSALTPKILYSVII